MFQQTGRSNIFLPIRFWARSVLLVKNFIRTNYNMALSVSCYHHRRWAIACFLSLFLLKILANWMLKQSKFGTKLKVSFFRWKIFLRIISTNLNYVKLGHKSFMNVSHQILYVSDSSICKKKTTSWTVYTCCNNEVIMLKLIGNHYIERKIRKLIEKRRNYMM